jgi:hypothetical protein
MTTAATSLLGLALPVTSELAGTWGDVVNNSLTSLLDTAVAGTTTISTDADVTLTTTALTANQARQAIILWTANGTTTRNITAPAQSKIYTVINASAGTQSIVLRGVGPTTGVTIVKGESAVCAWNGSDFIKISNTGGSASFTNVTVSGTTTLSGLTASTALALNSSKEVISVTNTGTGNNVLSASPTLTGTVAGASLSLSSLTSGRVTYAGTAGLLQDSSNLTFDGTTLTAGGLATGGSVTLSGGSANGVLYLNGSKVATSGSALTWNGSTLLVGGNTRFGSGAVIPGFATASDASLANNASLRGTNAAGSTAFELIKLNTSDQVAINNDGADAVLTSAATSVRWSIGGEQMRLTSTGLGIGTSSPSQKLHVVGNALVTPSGGWTTGGVATQYFGDIYGSIKYDYNTTNFLISSYGSFSIATNGTSPTTRLTLDSSGNLGLGVTPSAWDSTYKVLEVGYGGDAFLGNTGSNQIGVVNNGYWNGGWKYKNSTYANLYLQQTGQHQWWNAASGTAGNAISFTQAATLTANGNYLLGTTTEPTSTKSGNTYQAINSAVIEGTPYTTVSTSPVQLSRSSGVGLIAMISGYNTSGGAQGTWLVLVGNGVAIVVSSSDATATTPIFAVSSGKLTMQTTTGTLSVVCQIFTGA